MALTEVSTTIGSFAHGRARPRPHDHGFSLAAGRAILRWRLPLQPTALPRAQRSGARNRMQCSITKKDFLLTSRCPMRSNCSAVRMRRRLLVSSTLARPSTPFVLPAASMPSTLPRSDPDKIDVNVHCLDSVDLAALKSHSLNGRQLRACDRGGGAVAVAVGLIDRAAYARSAVSYHQRCCIG